MDDTHRNIAILTLSENHVCNEENIDENIKLYDYSIKLN